MRKILIALALAFVAFPVLAQTRQQLDDCNSSSATDDATIAGCTALINSGRYSGHNLSAVYNNRSAGYIGKKEWDMVIADANTAIQLDSTNAESYIDRCAAYIGKALYNQAISDCTQAIALKSNDSRAYYNRAGAYEQAGSRDQAITDYRTAAQLNPTNTDAQNALKRLGATN
jgi:tetratricopeptide (TPR) repeat protein